MIDIGMPTLIELPDIEDCAYLCRELGMQFIELNMNLPQYQANKIDTAKMKAISRDYGIYFTIHLDENLNTCDFNTYVSGAYMQTVLETIKTAKELSIPLLNMHLSKGVYFTLPHKKVYLFDEYKDIYLASMRAFRDECDSVIGDSHIMIDIENSDGYTDFHTHALDILLESKAFGLTFDIGHDYVIDGADEPIILNYKDKISHFHFHDALNRKDHLALGTGEIDLQKYLSLSNELGGRIVLETKTIDGLRQSAKWIKCQKLNR